MLPLHLRKARAMLAIARAPSGSPIRHGLQVES